MIKRNSLPPQKGEQPTEWSPERASRPPSSLRGVCSEAIQPAGGPRRRGLSPESAASGVDMIVHLAKLSQSPRMSELKGFARSGRNGGRQSRIGGALLLSAMLTLLCGCTGPSRDQAVLQAIKAETELLATTHPITPPQGWADVPEHEWPPTIASLQPNAVTIHPWGVHISIKPYFDGGWGYGIPRRKQDLPMPEQCYSEPGPGVFWHGPC